MLGDYQREARERMLRLLKSIGIYRLDGSSAVEKEIGLYADYIGQLEDQIRRLADNCFLDSVTREGFEHYRALYSLPEKMSWAVLQELIKTRIGITNRDFTVEGARRCMASGGFGVGLSEDFERGQVIVTVHTDAGAFGTRAEGEAFLRGCLPCHVKAVFQWEA